MSETILDTNLAVTIFTRPLGQPTAEWQELDQGPGRITIPGEYEVYVRARNIDDVELYGLVRALVEVPHLTYLNLSENRKISDVGLSRLAPLTSLTRLNLSSCSITGQGLSNLTPLKKLEVLDISYCNRLTDESLRVLKTMPRLMSIDIQGCVKTSHAGVRKIERRGLTIHR